MEHRRVSPDRASAGPSLHSPDEERELLECRETSLMIHLPVTFGRTGPQDCTPDQAQPALLRDTAGSQKSPNSILNFILLDKLFLWRKIPFLERSSQQSSAPAVSPCMADAILTILVWRRAKKQNHCHEEHQFLAQGRSLYILL